MPVEEVPGGYRCSVPENDFIVDYMVAQPDVLGAKILGAGLGGCVMAFVDSACTGAAVEGLKA
ncbi:MAG: hypothetical protein JW839_12010, partial [Candidatus Lokiarchaeota archaeon]|nr:hypothetical protein [Candidatus Lokiarchaeota archaeon]